MGELTNRRHRYQFVKEESHKAGLYQTSRQYVTIRHSKYGEQDWILREGFYDRKCDGTGKPIAVGEACYSLVNFGSAPNKKARLSVEFVELLKQQPERAL